MDSDLFEEMGSNGEQSDNEEAALLSLSYEEAMAIPDNTTVFDPEKSPILEEHLALDHSTPPIEEIPVEEMPLDAIIVGEQLPLFDRDMMSRLGNFEGGVLPNPQPVTE